MLVTSLRGSVDLKHILAKPLVFSVSSHKSVNHRDETARFLEHFKRLAAS